MIPLLLAVAIFASPRAPAQTVARFVVVLDAAHGGSDTGTILAPQLLEKNLVLAVSVRLRSALAARGMAVVTTRENDVELTAEARASAANTAGAQACLVLHATASGSGVHLYTSSLDQSARGGAGLVPGSGGLVPWSTAGAPFATRSLELASALSTAFSSAGIPYTLGRVHLPPMDSMRCPTVAVELAPLHPAAGHGDSATLEDEAYRTRLVGAMADALVAWRGEHAGAGIGAVPEAVAGAGR